MMFQQLMQQRKQVKYPSLVELLQRQDGGDNALQSNQSGMNDKVSEPEIRESVHFDNPQPYYYNAPLFLRIMDVVVSLVYRRA